MPPPFVFLLCVGIAGLSGCVCTKKAQQQPPPDTTAELARRANDFLEKAPAERTVFAAELHRRMEAGESLFIVDVRDRTSFAKGHVPTAVHIPIDDLFTETGLKRLPGDDVPVVVVSENGHLGGLATGLLGTLGHNAFSLRFGMLGWDRATPVQVSSETQAPQTLTGLGGPLEP